jgi:tRNA U38,U39,U40 pseudouridine synthase TruA
VELLEVVEGRTELKQVRGTPNFTAFCKNKTETETGKR